MRVPAPARSSSNGGEPFAAVLDQAVQAAPAEVEPRPDPRDQHDAKPDDHPADQAAELPPEPREHPEVGDERPADTGAADSSPPQQAAAPEVTETLRRGESERQETAGKGTDSPRTSPAKAANTEPLLVAVMQHTAQDRGVTSAPVGNGVAAIGATKTGEALTRGFDAGWARTGTPGRAPAVAAGYRTDNAARAELLENARDSVFKQILMQLNGDGGEMRVRLQPPDLGELDLRLLVEHGNKLTLSITAERADMTALLQKHLDELKQTLQASGLEVTDAQVHQRGAGARDDGSFRSREQRNLRDEAATAADAMPQLRRSWVTAEGLDFWA